jgi:alkanesulfonate monooxygenase SsuD/methylene tetrahydromethanopterin reductase-like flavin-dependent oxidoreductase (luciferase family)
MTERTQIHLAVALDGAGWHPAAWREPSARPLELFSAGYWVDLVSEAERGLLDFVTIDDSLALQSAEFGGPDTRTDEVRGRLDALLIAARVSPVTAHIGLIPTVTTTHTEPFHISTAVATLDYTSGARAGWQVKVSGRADEAQHFGRREVDIRLDAIDQPQTREQLVELFDEAAEVVEVVRRLWDSWEDDAEIRDTASDRFIDAEKLHRVDFAGRWFSVRGPSITPRPPQGQPVVAALAHVPVAYRLAARSADVVFITPTGTADATAILAELSDAGQGIDRGGERLRVFADLIVFLDGHDESAADRLGRLDALGRTLHSDARVFTGSAAELADELAALADRGIDGFRLRPGVVTDDLPRIVNDLVPELQRRGLFREHYEADTLRGLLGLPSSVPNRYARSAA